MKQNLKKMLLALIMGISIVGAGNVQAQEKEWVRSGDYDVYYVPIGPLPTKIPLGTAATLDGICQDIAVPWAASRANTVYKYDEEYHIYIYGGKRTSTGAQWISCYYTDVENRRSNAGVYFTCDGDMIDLDRPDGCYAKECHEGTVDVGGICVVPCTGIGEDGTASPKGCVPVNAPECDEKYNWVRDYGATGFVSCNNGVPSVCSYENPKYTDPEAAKYGRECTFVHETQHIADRYEYISFCANKSGVQDDNGIIARGTEAAFHGSERDAYRRSAACLAEKAEQCSTPTCKKELEDMSIEHAERAEKHNRCVVFGIGC